MRPKVRITICALAAVAAVAGLIPDGASAMDKKVVVGWVERVRIFPGNLVVTAKLDTGADNSSLHVADFQLFTRDGSQWVRFEAFDEAGRTVSLERPVLSAWQRSRDTKNPVRTARWCCSEFAWGTTVRTQK